MGKLGIEVIKPGLSTTIQDLGRTGYQKYGMVVAGAMDSFALRVGNLLVGNEEGAAAIEAAIQGPELRFQTDTAIAVTGANLSPMLNGKPIACWKSYAVDAGETLSFGKPVEGVYAYIAVNGGIATERVMDSRSTFVKGNVGGLHGRFLGKGDVLPIGHVRPHPARARQQLRPDLVPDYRSDEKIRVILGPDEHAFTEEGMEKFLSTSYTVTPKTDRMGARLEGERISHRNGADILSDAVFPGTIQVPANGQPIVMFADRQPTGGYTRIATVITEDIPRVVQSLPGTKLTFESVSLEYAQQLYRHRENLLHLLGHGVRPRVPVRNPNR